MRQVVIPQAGQVVVAEVPRPEPSSGEVLLQVAAVGICGSDLHVFHDQHPFVSPPLVQGHEFSAWLVPADETLSDDSPAPRSLVVVNPAIGCGGCAACERGLAGQCPTLAFIGGQALAGAMSDYLVVPADALVPMRPGTDPLDAAMVEPLACAVRAVGRVSSVAGRASLVVGGGTIGNLVSQVAVDRGSRVALLESSEIRRDVARRCGLAAFGSPEAALEHLGGHVDVAFDCAGAASALETCIELVAAEGTVVVVGVHSKPPVVDISAVQDRELSIIGSLMYSRDEFVEAATSVSEGSFQLAPMRTHTFPLSQVAAAYETLDNPKAGALKVMIEVHAE